MRELVAKACLSYVLDIANDDYRYIYLLEGPKSLHDNRHSFLRPFRHNLVRL